MTRREINLLPTKTFLEKELQKRLQRKTLLVSIAVLTLAILVVAGLFFYINNLKNQAAIVNTKIKGEERRIQTMTSRESLLFILKTKISAASKILSSRPAFDKTLEAVTSLLPSGATLESFNSGKTEYTFSVSVENSDVLEVLLEALTDPQKGGSTFQSLTLVSANYAENGAYKLAFKATTQK